jgi:hypothetical protein
MRPAPGAFVAGDLLQLPAGSGEFSGNAAHQPDVKRAAGLSGALFTQDHGDEALDRSEGSSKSPK